jgi:hypothetical protein
MRITLKGKTEADSKSWDYNERLSLQEAMTIKDKLGLTVMGFTDGLMVMDPYALAGLLWLVRSRAGEPELDPRMLDFDLGDLDIEDPDETAKEAAAAAADPPVPPAAAPEVAASTTPTPEEEEVAVAAV